MSSRKTANKTTKKASASFDWSVDTKSNKKTKNKVNKQLKKLSFKAIVVALLILTIGALGGYFGAKFIVKDDCFLLNGKDEITLQIGETYLDEGVKVVAFGKDDANKVEVKTNLIKNEDGKYTSNEIGTFYIAYTVKNLKYGSIFKIQKIRLITFVEPSEQEEIASANQGGNV